MLLLLPLPHPMSTALLHVWLWPVLASTSIRAGPGSRRAHTRSASAPAPTVANIFVPRQYCAQKCANTPWPGMLLQACLHRLTSWQLHAQSCFPPSILVLHRGGNSHQRPNSRCCTAIAIAGCRGASNFA